MNKELKEIITKLDRYKNFKILEKPIAFKDMFNEDIDVVQLHSIQTFDTSYGKDIVGFCGAFSYLDKKVKPLDGDCYSEDTLVFGYDIWENEDEGITKGVDILVGNDW